jgi:hypothetical protein
MDVIIYLLILIATFIGIVLPDCSYLQSDA